MQPTSENTYPASASQARHSKRSGSLAGASLIDALLEAPPPTNQAAEGGCIVGECIADRHPTLTGRVQVRWTDAGGDHQCWVPTLYRVPVRVADRVLLMRPANFEECIVVGVLDGFTRRPEPPRAAAAALALKCDEAVHIIGEDGQPLVELFQDDTGPVVRLLQEDVNLELPGRLRVKAARIDLEADQGSVAITASDDVNVRGEVINLN